MTTLAADKVRAFEIGDRNDLPVIANDIIYEGAAVGENGSGYMRPLAAGDAFVGFAIERVDNTGGSAGDKTVAVRQKGRVQLPVSGAAIGDLGKPVYASDDDTFTLTQSTNSYIGRIVRWVSTGVVIVAYDATRSGFGLIAALTDSTGGTADGTLAAVGATNSGDVSAAINNNFADLAAKMNAVLKYLND
jgi:hypothetical protein